MTSRLVIISEFVILNLTRMQRITDIWQNLVRYRNQQQEEGAGDSQSAADDKERDDELGERHKNQYWTRIVSLQGNRDRPINREQLTPDIIESLNAVQELDGAGGQEVLFDPHQFYKRNPNLERADFELSKAELEDWGVRVAALRE